MKSYLGGISVDKLEELNARGKAMDMYILIGPTVRR